MKRAPTVMGFTAPEMMISFGIIVIVMAAATSGWIYTVRGERMNSTQVELDINVRTAMENLKNDLRLSALDRIYYYPAGPGPYTAISIPMASDTNNDGLIERTADGSNILWTSTIIYHVWNGSPNELRKTVFSPRDNSLTPAQFQAQLNSVVTNGDGSHTYGAANASSRPLFKNLFTWTVWGNGSTYDGYASTLSRDTDVSFGSIYLTNGPHQVTFTVIGKNVASTGYKIGLDTLTASACGVEREGEAQLPVAAQTGASAGAEYMSQGSWSGNYQLSFPASGTNSSFTLNFENDCWEETNFRGQGALRQRTVVGFDPSLSPMDYILQLEGSPGYPWGRMVSPDWYAWSAANQTGTNAVYMEDNALTSSVVRILLRGGAQAINNGNIRFSGSCPTVYFQASTEQNLYIIAAYIAEAASSSNCTMNAASAGTQLYFGGSASINILPGQTVSAQPYGLFATDSSKSYLITYLIGSYSGCAAYWPETNPDGAGNYIGSYVIPGSAGPTAADAQAADWTGKPYTLSPNLYAVCGLYSTYPTNGLFTSQIFDTKMDTPVYTTISWNSICPANTSIQIKVRTGANADMSDASDWSAVAAFSSSPANITCGNKRYVQFQAILNPDTASSTYKGKNSPKLQNVTVKWGGATKIVDVGATMTKGPNYGIFQVTVDGQPLTQGLRVDLSIFKNIDGWGASGKMITSSMTTEIAPRNTGK